MKKMNFLTAAMILGLSFFVAIYFVKPIGVSTQFNVLSGMIQNLLDDDLITEDDTAEYGYTSTNVYYNKDGGKLAYEIEHPWNYDFVFVLAIPFGSFLGYLLTKKKQKSNSCRNEAEDDGSCPITTKKSRIRNYIFSFVGGFVLLFGARMANGCTSGHMMSGMMQGSVSGYVFAVCAFATAIPTAILLKRYLKGGR